MTKFDCTCRVKKRLWKKFKTHLSRAQRQVLLIVSHWKNPSKRSRTQNLHMTKVSTPHWGTKLLFSLLAIQPTKKNQIYRSKYIPTVSAFGLILL